LNSKTISQLSLKWQVEKFVFGLEEVKLNECTRYCGCMLRWAGVWYSCPMGKKRALR
jgi:hypothetical protein